MSADTMLVSQIMSRLDLDGDGQLSIKELDESVESAMAWLSMSVALACMGVFLHRSYQLLQPGQAAAHVQVEWGVVLRSGTVLMAIALLPLLLPCRVVDEGEKTTVHSWGTCPTSPYPFLPLNFMHQYPALPFWYAYVVTTHLGPYLLISWQALAGTFLGMIAISTLNCLMPGGAGRSLDAGYAGTGWLPAYSAPIAFVLAVVTVYIITATPLMSTGTKQYALSMFSGLIVGFMDPTRKTGFRVVVVNFEGEWNWNGVIMCEFYIVALANLLGAISLGFVPWSRNSVEKHTSVATGATELDSLATDIRGYLEWILSNFLHYEAEHVEFEVSFNHVHNLGSRCSLIEGVLQRASWECWGSQSQAQLGLLWAFAGLLRQLLQVLRVEIEHVRSFINLRFVERDGDLVEPLDEFLAACGEALTLCAHCCKSQGKLDEATRTAVTKAAERADKALGSALAILAVQFKSGSKSAAAEMALIDGLRSWPSLISAFAAAGSAEASAKPLTLPKQATEPWRARHWSALRNTTSWTLALLWSNRMRSYNGGCVQCLAMLFSSTPGSAFNRNTNRILGVGMGLAFGSLPGFVILQSESGDIASSPIFAQRVVVYLVVMFFIWAVAMYGTIASGSKHSYACILWAGCAGMHMMHHMPHFNDQSPGFFMNLLDNCLACVIVFLVDLSFEFLSGTGLASEAEDMMCQCLSDTTELVGQLQDGQVKGVDIAPLEAHIKHARFLASEAHAEGFVWSALGKGPDDFTSAYALLDLCDSVAVTVYGIQGSAMRCSSAETSSRVVMEVLHGDLTQRCKLFESIFRAWLRKDYDVDVLKQLLGQVELGRPPEEHTPKRSLSSLSISLPHGLTSPLLLALDDCQPAAADTAGVSDEVATALEMAATVAVRLKCASLRTALQRVGSALAAEAALSSRDWRCANTSFGKMGKRTSVTDLSTPSNSTRMLQQGVNQSPLTQVRRRRASASTARPNQ